MKNGNENSRIGFRILLNLLVMNFLAVIPFHAAAGSETENAGKETAPVYICARLHREDKWGFIDQHGEWLIKPRWDVPPLPLFEGVIGGSRTLASPFIFEYPSGKAAVHGKYQNGSVFCQGRAAVYLNRKWFFIDRKGKQIGMKYGDVRNFKNGLAPVMAGGFTGTSTCQFARGGKWGYIELSGREIIQPQFDLAANFNEGLACVHLNGKRGKYNQVVGSKAGFINTEGEMVIEPQYDKAGNFSQGLAYVLTGAVKINGVGPHGWVDYIPEENSYGGGKMGFIDTKGKMVIEPAFDDAQGFSEGFAAVYTVKKWWHEETIARRDSPFYRGINYSKRYGLQSYRPKGKDAVVYLSLEHVGEWYFIDKEGEKQFGRTFDEVRSFRNGFAAVKIGTEYRTYEKENYRNDDVTKMCQSMGGKWGLIDIKGKTVVNPRFSQLIYLPGGFFGVQIAPKDSSYSEGEWGKWGIINSKGDFLAEPRFNDLEKLSWVSE